MQPKTSSTLASSGPRIAHGFFGRAGGVSAGIYASLNCGAGSRDDAANVVENKKRVKEALGADKLVTLAQVHSNLVHVIPASAPAKHRNDSLNKPEADALVTNQPNLALGILTADCGPVLFADPQAGVIGAAHAGWKGAKSGVLENSIAAMESLGAKRDNIIAALGPTIAQSSYQVCRSSL
jgi:YfiH family protein